MNRPPKFHKLYHITYVCFVCNRTFVLHEIANLPLLGKLICGHWSKRLKFGRAYAGGKLLPKSHPSHKKFRRRFKKLNKKRWGVLTEVGINAR